MMRFPDSSKRLEFRLVTEKDFEDLVEVYNSNPVYLEISEGTPKITVEAVKRDHEESLSFENGYSVAIREKGASKVIGVAQFIQRNPRDNNPWLGLIMLHKEKQKLGYAREFFEILLTWYQDNGFSSLHLGVLEKNQEVIPFYERIGFVRYGERETPKLGKVICMSLEMTK